MLVVTLATPMSVAGCNDGAPSESDESAGTAETGDDADGDEDASEDGTDGQEPVDPDEGVFAAGVSIDRVEINQGVGIEIAAGGQMLPSSSWVAPLIGGRPGLIRVLWSTDASFSPREVLARVTLEHSDGTSTQFEQTRTIAGPPDPGSLDGTFAIEFGEDSLREGDAIIVGLFEVDPDQPGTPDAAGQRLPAEGSAAIDVIGGAMTIKVVVVPANDPAVDGASYEPTTEIREMLETDLYNLYPVNAIEVEYHAPVEIEDCYDGGAILAQLSGYRNSEDQGANVYYHAIFPNSHEGSCWAGGMAWLVDDSMGADRVSYSVNHWGESPNNVTHELGHSNGREHSWEDGAYQPSSSGSPDCGRRATWGWPLREGQHPKAIEWDFPQMQTLADWLIAPTEGLVLADYCEGHADYETWGPALNDVMSYAFPYWISAHTYRHLAERIATLSSWDNAAVVPDGESLHGVFLADGGVRWYVMPGRRTIRDASPTRRARGEGWTLPAAAKITGDGDVRGVVIPLPDAAAGVVDVDFDGRTLAADLDAIRAR